jgi:hypothetical protein
MGKPKNRKFTRIDPLTSTLLIFPLFLAYELGILFVPSAYNGADLVTAQILRLLHGQLGLYLAINGGLALVFLVVVLVLRKKHHFDPGRIWSLLFESAIYALTMGTLICFVMVDLLHIDPRLSIPALRTGIGQPPFPGSIIIALGAGVHEELIFRVVGVGGFAIALERVLRLSRGTSLTIAFVVSSLLFSAAHHVIGGEPVRIGVFVYRTLCGLFFASIYQLRGAAVAVYTHTLYDIYVFIFS